MTRNHNTLQNKAQDHEHHDKPQPYLIYPTFLCARVAPFKSPGRHSPDPGRAGDLPPKTHPHPGGRQTEVKIAGGATVVGVRGGGYDPEVPGWWCILFFMFPFVLRSVLLWVGVGKLGGSCEGRTSGVLTHVPSCFSSLLC